MVSTRGLTANTDDSICQGDEIGEPFSDSSNIVFELQLFALDRDIKCIFGDISTNEYSV